MSLVLLLGLAGGPVASAGEASSTPVPWDRVGDGWLLITRASHGQTSLVLRSPANESWSLARWASSRTPGDLVAWSGDGRRALFRHGGTVTEVDLATAEVAHRFTVKGLEAVMYSAPSGSAVVTARSIERAGRAFPDTYLERRALDGRMSATLFHADQGGAISSAYLAGGSELVVSASQLDETGAHPVIHNPHLRLVSNAGRQLRVLRGPADCKVLRMWDPRRVLAGCSGRLWLVPVNGNAATALTPVPDPRRQEYGFITAVHVPTATVVEVAGACGYTFIERLHAHASPTALTPNGIAGNVYLKGAQGRRVVLIAISSDVDCGGHTELLTFDPITGATSTLIRSGVEQVLVRTRN